MHFVFESRDVLDEAACLLAGLGLLPVAHFFDGHSNVGGQSLGSCVGCWGPCPGARIRGGTTAYWRDYWRSGATGRRFTGFCGFVFLCRISWLRLLAS